MTEALQLTCSDRGQEFAFSGEDPAFSRNAPIPLPGAARRAA